MKMFDVEKLHTWIRTRADYISHRAELVSEGGLLITYSDTDHFITPINREGQAAVAAIDAYYAVEIARIENDLRGAGVEIDETEDE